MKTFFPPARRPAGVALVIVLSLVVLLTTVIVAFFARAVLDRQTSSSSAGVVKADVLARGALDEIVLDLKQEIAAGSRVDTPPTGTPDADRLTLYLPKPGTSSAASTVTPALVPSPTSSLTPLNPANVLKRSVFKQPFFDGANYDATNFPPSNLASAVNSSANPAPDGRYVSGTRWNKPLLLDPGQIGDDAGKSAAVYNNYFAAPDWVLVTRGGPKAFSAWQDAAKKDGDLTNMDYVVGRYAYVVYDEGGLLDINQAGFPSSLANDPDFTARRGRLAQVDLAQIPGIADADAIVPAFRNAKTAANAASYKKYVFSNTPANPGFLLVVPGDQTFLGRQDLLGFQQGNPTAFSPSALQYLGTFSREKNAPTFTPSPTRPKVQPGKTSHPDPNPAYAADPLRAISLDPGNANTFGSDDGFNPSLLTTRNSAGKSVLTQRFPLSRLALLTATGPAAGASAADIKKYFGLVWDNSAGAWIYTSPDGTGSTPANVIKFLKNVPGTRAPDFFETLQATVHVGSLGRDADGEQYYNQPYEPGISSTARIEAQNVYYHVLQIGANIIDQADADSYPTLIQFGGETIAGIENLPYPVRIFDYIHRSPTDPDTVFGDYVFEMWNPHQNLPVPPSAVPTEFRIVGVGGSAQLVVDGKYATPADIPSLPPVEFSTSSTDYRSPVRLGSGFRVGAKVSPGNYVGFIYGNPHSTFAVQYRGPDGNWREYQKFRRVLWQIKESFNLGTSYAEWFHERVDPRTDRFGTSMNYLPGDSNFGASAPIGSTIRMDASNGYYLGENTPFATGIFSFGNGGSGSSNAAKNSTMGTISDNKTNSAVYYRDPDGVVRPADGANRSGTEGQPLATGNFPSRPLILNRPFRSVGELGYVFRDVPFKSLDFTDANSGDLALLDAFTVDDAEVVAGHVNLNTRQVEVLVALLMRTAKQESTLTDAITVTEARTLAQALVSRTTDPNKGPLLDRTEIVAKFGPEIVYQNPTNLRIKTQREAALRSLAECANTRTWNLMIDVIAQSGRYAPAAANLSAFTVTGERRFWLHLALDRYTGKIVDQQLEPVNE